MEEGKEKSRAFVIEGKKRVAEKAEREEKREY